MQKLTQAQISDSQFKIRKTITPAADAVYRAVGELGVGEGLQVNYSEWPFKYTPTTSQIPARYISSIAKFTVRTLADNSGFIIIRKS